MKPMSGDVSRHMNSFQRTTPPRYIPAMDGVRALSVLLVVLAHSISGSFATFGNPGGLGVRIFFVISGYLITGILIDYAAQKRSTKATAVQFYWRRVLRLTPPLLTAIVVAAALNIQRMRELWWVHSLYLSNFQIAIEGHWNGAGHFWSLATEEQFYMAWFPLMMFMTARGRLRVVIAALILGCVFRLGAFLPGAMETFPMYFCLPFANTDTLAIGALLTLAERDARFSRLFNLFRSWPLMVASLLIYVAANEALPELVGQQIGQVAADVFGCCLVRFALDPHVDPKLRWLTWKPVRHIGKISYGLYVYHFFVPDALRLFYAFPLGGMSRRLFGLVFIAITFAVAELSWRFIEKPILALKRVSFPAIGYDPRPATLSAGLTARPLGVAAEG
jgi:peptidoglycan/LPS O-acetylase OafA/YrhL